MPPRIFSRNQPRFQGSHLRHGFGRVERSKRFRRPFRFRKIPRAAQSINHADRLFGIKRRAAPPKCHGFTPPLPRQIVAVQIIRHPSRVQGCFRRRVQGAGFFQYMRPGQKAPRQNRMRRIRNQSPVRRCRYGLRASRMCFRNIGRGIAAMRAGLQPARHGGTHRLARP